METIEQKWQRVKAERAERVNVKNADLPASYKQLKGDMCVMYCTPVHSIEAMMTGTNTARQNKRGEIILTYTDGSEERALCPEIDLCAAPEWLHVVGTVQAKRFHCPKGYGECEDARGCVYPGRC